MEEDKEAVSSGMERTTFGDPILYLCGSK